MTLLIAIPLSARIIQVLKDFLPAELDLIDTEANDGITTPDIPTANYHETVVNPVPETPAILVNVATATVVERRVLLMGGTSNVQVLLNVMVVTALDDAGEDALTLQQFTMRYVAGIYRTLTIRHERLDTIASSSAFVENTVIAGALDYGPDATQEPGAMVRTGIVPLNIRVRETI